jgi:hypothetical protein
MEKDSVLEADLNRLPVGPILDDVDQGDNVPDCLGKN